MAKTFDYFDHEADIGIIGRGKSLTEAFEAAAAAMFAIMIDPSEVGCSQVVEVAFEEEDVEFALVVWLNALLAQSHRRHLALARFDLKHSGSSWEGKAWGEPWRKEMPRGVEVKGATLTMLSVMQKEGIWEARCVVDV